MDTANNPKRGRVLLQIVLGLAAVGAWCNILWRYRSGRIHWVAIAGIVTTVAMMGVLGRSYATRRGFATAALVLSLATLVLGIVAMAIAAL